MWRRGAAPPVEIMRSFSELVFLGIFCLILVQLVVPAAKKVCIRCIRNHISSLDFLRNTPELSRAAGRPQVIVVLRHR